MYVRHVNLTEIDIVIGFLLSFFELEEFDWLIICMYVVGAHLCAVLPGQYRSTAGSTAKKLILH